MIMGHTYNRIKNDTSKKQKKVMLLDNELLANVLNKLWFISFIFLIFILKEDIFNDKSRLPSGIIGYYVTIYNLMLVMSVIANYKNNNIKFILFQCPALIVTVFQGHRSYIVFILIAILVNEFINNNIKVSNGKKALFVLCTGMFGFLGKPLIIAIRMNMNLFEIIGYIFDKQTIINSIIKSEPFVTQYILNKTITSEFSLNLIYLKRVIMKLVLISPSRFENISSFYNEFINRFFPNIDYGIAYNIFSEPYAIAGMFGVFLFIVIYAILVNFIDKVIRSDNSFISSYGLSLSSIFNFYIFRNSIENIILWFQIYTFILAICFFIHLIKYRFKIKFLKFKK